MFWFTAPLVLYSKGKMYNCSSGVRGLGDGQIHAYKTTHCHYNAQPAELPLLWFSSGKEAGKAISPYGQVYSARFQNQLVVGLNGQV